MQNRGRDASRARRLCASPIFVLVLLLLALGSAFTLYAYRTTSAQRQLTWCRSQMDKSEVEQAGRLRRATRTVFHTGTHANATSRDRCTHGI